VAQCRICQYLAHGTDRWLTAECVNIWHMAQDRWLNVECVYIWHMAQSDGSLQIAARPIPVCICVNTAAVIIIIIIIIII